MNLGQAKAITNIMCTLTTTILLEHVRPWLATKSDCPIRLNVESGRGNKTYHKRMKPNHHKIIYGPGMVLSKYENSTDCIWLSEKEINNRGYYEGDTSMPSLLAHTCCHEFAHFIQTLNGWRRRGQVHNEEFYSILDRIHSNQVAEKVRGALYSEMIKRGLPVDRTENLQKSIDPEPYIRSLVKGDPLVVLDNGSPLIVTYMKSNRTTINIIYNDIPGRISKRAVVVPV